MTDKVDMATILADFDRLALLESEGWNHNNHYHDFLLRHVPVHCRNALEIGCGSGTFARLLSQKSEHVLALDLSPRMISLAKERSTQYTTIDYQVADVLSWDFVPERFDCIVSIATLHHLSMEDMLTKLKTLLAPNGTLIVLDLYQARLSDYPTLLIAIPVNLVLKFLKTGHVKEPEAVREAWAEHGKHDIYLTLAQLRAICKEILPGARVKRHLLWRYSLVWRKR
ncbi:MAG TPA: class I SAM-dependent methyltransferase [Ktedonobacteraceae bacterium]|nr:class I SAM-dependent methyltransferase [Ktedonobacteraceae bacterium]